MHRFDHDATFDKLTVELDGDDYRPVSDAELDDVDGERRGAGARRRVGSTDRRIIRQLQERPQTVSELAERLGLHHEMVRKRLTRLRADGRAYTTGSGNFGEPYRWHASADEQPPDEAD